MDQQCHHRPVHCTHGQNQRSGHNLAAEDRGRVATAVMEARIPWVSGDWVLDCEGKVRSSDQRKERNGVLSARAVWAERAEARQVQLACHTADVLSRARRT